jgi:hypothetical protein
MADKPDWDAYALKMANRARDFLPRGGRCVALTEVPATGAIQLVQDTAGKWQLRDYSGLGIAVFFGTDGYLQNPMARATVHVIRRCLAIKGIDVLGFGTNDRKRPIGRAWAMVVRSDDVGLLATILNAAHAHVALKGSPAGGLASEWFEKVGIDPDQIPVDLDAFAG